MTDAELTALDAFLAEKVMLFPGAFNLASWSPTRDASDAEEVREKWLRAMRGITYPLGLGFDETIFYVRAHRSLGESSISLRIAELLAIARACGWKP